MTLQVTHVRPVRAGFPAALPEEGSTVWLAHVALLKGATLVLQQNFEVRRAIDAFHEAFLRYAQADETQFKSMVRRVLELLLEMARESGRESTAETSPGSLVVLIRQLNEDIRMLLLMLARAESHEGDASHALQAALDLYRQSPDSFEEMEAEARRSDAFRPYIDEDTPRVKIVSHHGALGVTERV